MFLEVSLMLNFEKIILRELRKFHLYIFEILILHKLLERLFHYSEGNEFGRECKMFKN